MKETIEPAFIERAPPRPLQVFLENATVLPTTEVMVLFAMEKMAPPSVPAVLWAKLVKVLIDIAFTVFIAMAPPVALARLLLKTVESIVIGPLL